MKWLIVLLLCLSILSPAEAGHLFKEKVYQQTWCSERGGISEYVLDDGSRVDCLLDEYAVEFDFARKWAESIGQALYYGLKTGRQPAVVLIMETPGKDSRHLKRLEVVAKKYNLKIWTVEGR